MIRLAEEDDLLPVVSVLNQATLHLHKKGINQWSYPWDAEAIAHEIQNSCSYVLLHDDQIVGTFVIKNIDRLSTVAIEAESNYLARIAILPEFQGRNLGTQVIHFARAKAQALNKALYLDCWAGNKKLKEFYANNGFVHIGEFPEEDYFISVFKDM